MIHPGSTYLYIGLSTDPTPHSIPHLIAYRRKSAANEGNVAKEGGGVASERRGVVEEEGEETQRKRQRIAEDFNDESLVLKHCNEITVCMPSYRLAILTQRTSL